MSQLLTLFQHIKRRGYFGYTLLKTYIEFTVYSVFYKCCPICSYRATLNEKDYIYQSVRHARKRCLLSFYDNFATIDDVDTLERFRHSLTIEVVDIVEAVCLVIYLGGIHTGN